jgi:hypothetical protein
MEAEFVNEYINRLVANIHDLTSKNILLETRLAIAEKLVASLQVEQQEAKVSKPKKTEDPTV